jgi:RNA methyltransferase, TrmH family
VRKVTSRENPAFKAMAKLVAKSSERKRLGLSLIEGDHLLAAYLDSGATPAEIVVSHRALGDPRLARLVERAAAARVTLLADALFDSLSGVESPTGIITCVRTPPGTRAPATAPLVLLLEDIQDPGNVGTLLRCAAAAGAGHVLLSARCAFAWSPKVLRAGMGAHFALNIIEDAPLDEFVGTYRGTSIALSADADASIFELDLCGPVAFIVGNEGAGVSEPLKVAATRRARIPMPGRMESLNAGVAGAICLFEAVRQRGAAS